jgi:hypothetical protein
MGARISNELPACEGAQKALLQSDNAKELAEQSDALIRLLSRLFVSATGVFKVLASDRKFAQERMSAEG